jgi:putative transposase
MRNEGHQWNYKHVHRVYCALRLNLPRRTTRRVPKRVRQPLAAPAQLNQTWAIDFKTDTLYDARRVRLLTMIDEGNREGLEIAMGVSLPAAAWPVSLTSSRPFTAVPQRFGSTTVPSF